ncbi:MAG: FKBP-type peptidyl-prolyl cis-trans isomerase [Pseudomonadales bacterium]|nr:FKBP-type peptidyl-prolyl cis-trans isomerase [Pseudomonadales bacterium]
MRRYRYLLCFLICLPLFAMAEPAATFSSGSDASSVSDDAVSDSEQVSYFIGYKLGKNLTEQGIDELDYDSLWQGLLDARSELPGRYSEEQLLQAYDRYFEWKQLQKTQLESENLEKAQQFLRANMASESIAVTTSGLQYRVMVTGQGELVDESDWVRIRYQTKLADGTFISDSSATPAGVWVPVAELIPAWKEALMLMPIGSRWMLYAGPELTFGSQPPLNSMPANAALVFDLELLEVRAKTALVSD